MSNARRRDDGMQYTQSKVKITSPSKLKNLFRYLQWELATDHRFLNEVTMFKFDQAGFLILVLVFVSRDFELGTNVSCEESTVSPEWG